MGTRSLTVIKDAKREICVLYRQMDGYPSGHGQELKDFLLPFTVVNGISLAETRQIANGMPCLAAQVVAHFKTGPGDFYLYPAKTRDCGEEWIYTIYSKKDGLHLKVEAGAVTFFGLPGTKQAHMPALFDGPIQEFDPEATEKLRAGIEPPNDFVESQQQQGG